METIKLTLKNICKQRSHASGSQGESKGMVGNLVYMQKRFSDSVNPEYEQRENSS